MIEIVDRPGRLETTAMGTPMLISGGWCVLGGLLSLVLVAGREQPPVTADEPPTGCPTCTAPRLNGWGALPTAETRAPATGRRTLPSVANNPSRPDAAAVAPTTVSSDDGLVTVLKAQR